MLKPDCCEVYSNTSLTKTLNDQEIEELFLPVSEIKFSEKNFLDFLKKIIEHVYKVIQKDKMDNEYIENSIGKISTRKLISNGKTFYMNPCLDLSLVTIEGLKKSGLKNTKLVIKELFCIGNRITLHFGIEITLNGKVYHIDHTTNNVARIGIGTLNNNYTEENKKTINTIYLDANKISTDDSFNTLMKKGLINLKYFNQNHLETHKEVLKKSNTDSRRKNRSTTKLEDFKKPIIHMNNQ